MFARCWVDLLAARPTKSSPNFHFVFFIFFVSHSHFFLRLSITRALSLSLLIWLPVANLWNNNRVSSGPPRLTAQPSHLHHRLNKQHDLPIKKAFTLIVLKQDLNATCSFSRRMPKVLANGNQAVLTCLKMKNYRGGGGSFFFLLFFTTSSTVGWKGGWDGGEKNTSFVQI